ncbi:MAG: Fic family protein [Myxococcales bacterium]|nr:Fic family protein [Myxococcales bacterium]
MPPVVRAGLLHARFETIHPYLDGNGRIGRLLVTLLLEHWGLLTRPLLYLSLFFKRHRQGVPGLPRPAARRDRARRRRVTAVRSRAGRVSLVWCRCPTPRGREPALRIRASSATPDRARRDAWELDDVALRLVRAAGRNAAVGAGTGCVVGRSTHRHDALSSVDGDEC